MRKHAVMATSLAAIISGCIVMGPLGSDRSGITWGPGSFDSVGEQIYFTGINQDGDRIRYSGGPSTGMMMGGVLSCASCHGPDARGGRHVMHMEVMDAPDIRWSVLVGEGHEEEDDHAHEHGGGYDLATFRRAVVEGEHPNGEPLSDEMPRWRMSDESLEALATYLQSLE